MLDEAAKWVRERIRTLRTPGPTALNALLLKDEGRGLKGEVTEGLLNALLLKEEDRGHIGEVIESLRRALLLKGEGRGHKGEVTELVEAIEYNTGPTKLRVDVSLPKNVT